MEVFYLFFVLVICPSNISPLGPKEGLGTMNLEFSLSDGTVHTSLQVIEKNFYKNIEAEIKGALMQI